MLLIKKLLWLKVRTSTI